MRRSAENLKRIVQRNLDGLSVGKPRPKATPGTSKVGAGIDTIIRADVKCVGVGSAIDLDRPYGQIGKVAADAGPRGSAISRAENMAVSIECVHHRVRYLGVGGIDLNVIDSAIAGREVVLSPGGAVICGNKDLAGASE